MPSPYQLPSDITDCFFDEQEYQQEQFRVYGALKAVSRELRKLGCKGFITRNDEKLLSKDPIYNAVNM